MDFSEKIMSDAGNNFVSEKFWSSATAEIFIKLCHHHATNRGMDKQKCTLRFSKAP